MFRWLLRDKIAESFNLSELEELCYNINVDFENLPGNTLLAKSRELIEYCVRRQELEKLLAECQQQRPNASWVNLEREDEEVFRKSDSMVKDLPIVENLSILHGKDISKFGIEFLVSNPGPRELFIQRILIKYVDSTNSIYAIPPPVFNYELNLSITIQSDDGQLGSISGLAREPNDEWGREVYGQIVLEGLDKKINVELDIPFYLVVDSRDFAIVRIFVNTLGVFHSKNRADQPLNPLKLRNALEYWSRRLGKTSILIKTNQAQPIFSESIQSNLINFVDLSKARG